MNEHLQMDQEEGFKGACGQYIQYMSKTYQISNTKYGAVANISNTCPKHIKYHIQNMGLWQVYPIHVQYISNIKYKIWGCGKYIQNMSKYITNINYIFQMERDEGDLIGLRPEELEAIEVLRLSSVGLFIQNILCLYNYKPFH